MNFPGRPTPGPGAGRSRLTGQLLGAPGRSPVFNTARTGSARHPPYIPPRMPDGNKGGICVGTASTPSEPSFSLLRIEKDDLPPFPMTSPHPWRNGPPPFLSSSPGGKERTAFLSSSPALHGESEPRQGGWLKDSFCPTVTGRKMRRCCGARWRCRRRRRVRFRLLSVASGTVPRPARRNHLRGGLSVEGSDTHASP